jgi:mono/diheme cytochrome c family protein
MSSTGHAAGSAPANSARDDRPQVTLTSLKVENGGRLFQQYCVKCHGSDGTGKEMRARSTAIPNFTDLAWHTKRVDQQLAVSILEGKGTRMPGFRGRLGDKEAQDLVAYIRAMSPSPSAGRPPEAPPSEFESRFRELEQELGDLKKKVKKLDPGSGH